MKKAFNLVSFNVEKLKIEQKISTHETKKQIEIQLSVH